ncbi:probable disease resistance protein At4g27220 [Arachis stenosperma]|uniref:probable disease resistance protein At4g27220 n=1 Tax=Arachis stenosperma TaxID=217475 RepID=UPI0025ABC8E5|nr:probable disease resistance protein At4g27220 [Arachis stenosperma]
MAINIVGAITGVMSCLCTRNCLQESLGHHIRHLRRPKRNLNKLKSLLEELDARKVDMCAKLNQMWLQKGMNPKKEVELWLKNVDEIANEVNKIIREVEQESGSTSVLSPFYYSSRIKRGELIEKKMEEVRELLEKGRFADDSLAETSPQKGQTLPTTKLMEHETTMKNLTKILNFILDDRVRIIGIHGMGGVGKTTIMAEINNRLLRENRLFDSVIWVSSSKDMKTEELQKVIAGKFDIDLSGFQDETSRAATLFEAFQRRKKFALILDDLWEPFSLERVGIPIPTVENGCKLLITTRRVSVCRGMETDRDVKVKALTENEAWDLFRDKVGDEALASPDIKLIAKDVAKECMGLPLGIVTVGLALRNATDISEWQISLMGLKASALNIEQMEESVFSRLKFSFTKLKDDTSRSCFLYCALYPEGNHVDANELIEYWMWEGLLGAVDSISASKQKGKIILNELKYACLLENAADNEMECVKMHDLIRDMAVTIMKTDPRWCCIVKAGNKLKKPPQIDEWTEDALRVSLMKNDLNNIFLGNPPSCPAVTSLLLQYNSFPQNIPYDFFDFMQSLKVLDLSYTGIHVLPGSVSNLENLCALLLSNCWNLKLIPSVAKLTKLMVFDLSGCRNIKQLPHGTEQLCNLRRLNISNTMINILPSGFLSALTLLEELLASNALIFQKSLPLSVSEISISEIISSSRLSSLEVDFWHCDLYNLYACSGHCAQLEKFKFNVGPGEIQEFSEKWSVAFLSISIAKEEISIPANTTELKFIDCYDITELTTCLLHVEKLKKCTVVCCYSVERIVDTEQIDLSMLETLVLRYLINLQMICREVMTSSAFMRLKIINVEFCPNLKSLFSGNLLLQLSNLEEIRVGHCNKMEDLMRWEGGGRNSNDIHAAKIHLPRLRKLRLEFMPNLKGIFDGFISYGSPCSFQVVSCDALKRLPFDLDELVGLNQQLLSPHALEIKGAKCWWDSLEWDEPDAKQIMQTYFIEMPMVSDNVGSSSQVGAIVPNR